MCLALAIRLDIAPADITALTRFLLAHTRLPVSVEFAHVTLSWRGLHDPAAPLLVSASGLTLAASGTPLGHLDTTTLAIPLSRLIEGRFEPAAIAANNGALTLRRTPDGTIELIQGAPQKPTSPQPAIPPALQALRRLDLDAIDLTVTGPGPGLPLTAALTAHLTHQPGAAPTGNAHALLAAAGLSLPLDATLTPDSTGAILALETGPFDPASLAVLVPELALWHAGTTLAAHLALTDRLNPTHLTADLTSGPGTLAAPGADIPIRAATAHLDATPAAAGQATLAWTLDLATPTGAPAPTLSGTATLAGDTASGGRLDGTIDLHATPVPIPAIGTWWPPAVAKGGRQWVVKNLTAGTAANLAVHATLASHDGLAGLSLAAITGGFDGHNVDLWWLRPIDPIRNAEARLQIESEDSLLISLSSGHQGKLDVAGTTMRITGLTAKDQPADIHAHIKGPVPAILSLLAAPRLHLLSKQPLTLTDPSGAFDAQLHVTLPLDDKVTMEQVGIDAHVGLTDVHLGDVALGHSIDDGRFTIDATQDGLAMKGNAVFDALPVALGIDLDFRAGPPTQLTEHVHAATHADGAAIGRASTSFGRVLGGVVSLSADYARHRDKTAALSLAADLARATIATPFGWSKRAGPPAGLHADIEFDNDRLAAIDNLGAHGPDLDIATHGLAGAHGPAGLAFDRIVIGRTRAAGRLDFPAPAGSGPGFHLALNGAELDLAALFAPRTGKPPSPPLKAQPSTARPPTAQPPKDQPWSADLAFHTVTLANHIAIGGVRATASGRSTHIDLARASATGPVPATLTLQRAATGRLLHVDAADAGGLLAAFDLTDRIGGGHLAVAATLPNTAPADGTSGTVHLDRFTLKRVPAVVLLLRDLTVYGLADPAPKPDITVSRVTVPFTWRGGIVTLDHASAWQPALGLTAKGTVNTDTDALDLSGTIVPAYIFNTLPGRIPLLGKLFSPERGGGLFAATFSLKGPAGQPAVKVNPLAALLPGMLRDLLPH